MKPRPWPVVLAGLALLLVTSCSTTATDKDTPLPTRAYADVTRQADADAQLVADAAGTPRLLQRADPTPCTGRGGESADDGRWYLSTGFSLEVAQDGQAPAFQRIKNALQTAGWQITEETSFANATRGKLSARNPATGHTITLTTTKSLTQIAVFLDTPCVMPAPGENPLKD